MFIKFQLLVSAYKAQHAVRAAKMMKMCGTWAMSRYAMKRAVEPELLVLAMRLEKERNRK